MTESLIEKLEAKKWGNAGSPIGSHFYDEAISMCINIIRQHEADMQTKQSNPLHISETCKDISSEIPYNEAMTAFINAIDKYHGCLWGGVTTTDSLREGFKFLLPYLHTTEPDNIGELEAMRIERDAWKKEHANLLADITRYMEPVSVSLEKCAIALYEASPQSFSWPESSEGMRKMIRIKVKAILDSLKAQGVEINYGD